MGRQAEQGVRFIEGYVTVIAQRIEQAIARRPVEPGSLRELNDVRRPARIEFVDQRQSSGKRPDVAAVCTENLVRVDDVMESPKLPG